MKAKQTPIRGFGQRSITSCFLYRASNPFKKSAEEAQRESSKNWQGSLSDFVDGKRSDTSAIPAAVTGKSRPFSFLPVSKNGIFGANKEESAQTSGEIDKAIYEQFRHSVKGECAISDVEVQSHSADDNTQESKKRKYPVGVSNEYYSARKSVIVIGGDPEPRPKRRKEFTIRSERQNPIYNHYENGSGWWDCDVEGVDSEEVGYGEVWEGMGTKTFGEIDWH